MTTTDSVGRSAEQAGRQAADSRALKIAARAGFVARGVIYILIGVLAFSIAVGGGGRADRGGALAQLASHPGGSVLLWLLAVGFAGLALWRASEAAFGASEPEGQKAGPRLKSGAKAVLYGFFCVSTAMLAAGASSSATKSDTKESKELTATIMTHTGGRWLIGAVGLVVVVVAFFLAKEYVTAEFEKRMDLAGTSPRVRKAVELLGRAGGLARSVVVAIVGVFFVVAAVRFDPSAARGVDGSLRTLAGAPAGSVLLIVVALGLVAFGVFSWCEARWRRV